MLRVRGITAITAVVEYYRIIVICIIVTSLMLHRMKTIVEVTAHQRLLCLIPDSNYTTWIVIILTKVLTYLQFFFYYDYLNGSIKIYFLTYKCIQKRSLICDRLNLPKKKLLIFIDDQGK